MFARPLFFFFCGCVYVSILGDVDDKKEVREADLVRSWHVRRIEACIMQTMPRVVEFLIVCSNIDGGPPVGAASGTTLNKGHIKRALKCVLVLPWEKQKRRKKSENDSGDSRS